MNNNHSNKPGRQAEPPTSTEVRQGSPMASEGAGQVWRETMRAGLEAGRQGLTCEQGSENREGRKVSTNPKMMSRSTNVSSRMFGWRT